MKILSAKVDSSFEYDDDFRGPLDQRKCQDLFWLILFILFWLGMGFVAYLGFTQGEPKRLYYPRDWKGSYCGFDMTPIKDTLKTKYPNLTDPEMDWDKQFPNLENKKLVFFPAENMDHEFCVKECPKKGELSMSCVLTTENKTTSYIDDQEYCTYKSESYVKRCFPDTGSSKQTTEEKETEEEVSKNWENAGKISQILGDLVQAWYIILAAPFAAFILSFVWLGLMKRFSAFMVWFTICAYFVVVGAITYYFYLQYKTSKEKYESDQSIEGDNTNSKVFMYFYFISGGIFVISFLLVIFLRGRIRLAIQIVKEAAKAIQASKRIVLFPVITFLALACLYAWWVPVGIFMMAAGNPELKKKTNDGEDYWKLDYENDTRTNYATIYHLFGLFWTNAWIMAITQATVAGTIAQWYWTRDKENLPNGPVKTSFKRILRYHLGSLAFGSFILAFIQIIRFLMERLKRRVQRVTKDNRFVRYLLYLANYFLRCLELWIKFINQNAYIMIAVYGESFCKSTRRAWFLIHRNILRLMVVNVIGDFLLFLGKVVIAFLTMGGALALCMQNENMTFYVIPAVLCGLFGYLVAGAFMGVFEMSIDTILLCFCEDCERHDGSTEEKEPYASQELIQFMDTHNQTGKQKNKKKKKIDVSDYSSETSSSSSNNDVELNGKTTGQKKKNKGQEINTDDFRFLERYFYNKHAPFIRKFKWYIILIFLAIAIGFAVQASRLKPSEEATKMLPEEHFLRQGFTISSNKFASNDLVPNNYIQWGIESLDRDGVDPLAIEELGKVIYYKDWKPHLKASQEWVIEVCERARSKFAGSIFREGQGNCFMENFRDWVTNETLAGASYDFPVEEDKFEPLLNGFTNWARKSILATEVANDQMLLPLTFENTIGYDRR
eukprot:Anaeramoba_flamelloidesc42478_g1_i3.p1 GENE.c42478_g1_i3~~c42478_g1_i3.p1  ORF type:complete len:893 (+),score=172.02 c42478_g1_i3:107-2785(+)